MQEMTVATVAMKNRIGEPERSVKSIARWARKATNEGADLVAFPELCVSGYVQHAVVWDLAEAIPGPSTDALAELAADLGVVLSVGILEREADVVYNAQVLIGPDGIIGKQRKIHMPGREYLFWRGGFGLDVFDVGKARVGIMICYDAMFSEMARSLYFLGAELLLMPFAYNTGPRARFPEEDITGLCYRTTCFLNGCYGVLCNNAGSRRKNEYERDGIRFPGWAGVFDPEGHVVDFTRQRGNGEAMVLATLDPAVLNGRRRNTFFNPRCLRPEVYVDMRDSDRSGLEAK